MRQYTYATSAGANVPPAPFDIDAELIRLGAEVQRGAERLGKESALLPSQGPVIQASLSWQEVTDKLNSALQRVNEADRHWTEAEAKAAAGDPSSGWTKKDTKKVRSAERERTQMQFDAGIWAAELPKHEIVLREAMATRDQLISHLSF